MEKRIIYSVDIDTIDGVNIRNLEFDSYEYAKSFFNTYKKYKVYEGVLIKDIQLVKVDGKEFETLESFESFGGDDVAEMLCELKFGTEWWDGEDFMDENVEAYFGAIVQYTEHLEGVLELREDEVPLFIGNLNTFDLKRVEKLYGRL
jgi:hypothetical protein